MRLKIAALLVLILSFSSLWAQNNPQLPADWYQNKPIRAISFTGLNHLTRSELDGLFRPYSGKPFTDDLYWEILQKMYALEYFDDITPLALPGDTENETVLLQFTVTEKPVIASIKFNGNKKLRTTELLEKVTLKEGDIYNELKSRLDERAIRDFYLEKGYANIRISSSHTADDDGQIVLVFTIDEGKQTVVSSIEFEGNKVMASRTLKGTLSLKEHKFLSTGIFRESMLEEDKATITRYYNDRGYIDARIENVVREIDSESNEDKNLIRIVFILNEGEQFTYGGTTTEGNTIFTNDELLARIRMKEGDILNLSRFEEGFQAAADLYFENGYTSNYIGRQETRDNDRKRISYHIVIVESARSHIENIIIKGNTKTKEKVIIREFPFETGDIFSKAKLISGVRNLYNTRYFSVVSPDLVPGSEENLVDVVLNLEEQSTANVQFGVTFSGVTDAESFPLSVFVQWEDSNFLGNGQTLSANLTGSPDTQSASLGFAENWFLGSPLTVSFNFSLSHKVQYAYQDILFPIFDDAFFEEYGMVPDPYTSLEDYKNGKAVTDAYRMKYDQWEYGFGVSTGYRWFPTLATVTLRGGLNTSMMQNYYDDRMYRPADKGVRDMHGKWAWSNSVWSRLSFDKRDIQYDPSKGWFASEQLTFYGLIPDVEKEYYLRSDTKLEKYITLLNVPVTNAWDLKFVLAGYSGLSFITPLRDKQISEANKLYIDGMFIGRGWNTLYASAASRGNMMLNHWLELRVPLAPGIIAFDFYLDAVAIKSDLDKIGSLSLNDYYFSYGPSLRFSIPQFPLRLMLANTFQLQDGKVRWGNGIGPEWKFVLSFNIANM